MRWFLGTARPGGVSKLDLNAIYQGPALVAEPSSGTYLLTDGGVGQYTYKRGQANPVDVGLGSYTTFTRSGVGATDFDVAGTLTEYAANTLRSGYSGGQPLGWLLEGVATNFVRNPRNEGLITGSPGTPPTNWGLSVDSGLTRTIVGSGTENGIPYFDIQFAGVAATAGIALNVTGESTVGAGAATHPSTNTTSAWIKLIAGAIPGTLSMGYEELDAARAGLSSWRMASFTVDGTWTRRSTTVATANAATAYIRPQVWFYTGGIGAVIDCTLRFGGHQLEANYYASSLILPPAAAPAAQVRNLDALTISGSAFSGIFGANAPSGYAVVELVAPRSVSPITQAAISLNDGSTTNRIDLRSSSGGNYLIQMSVGGVLVLTTGTIIALPDNTIHRIGMTWDRNEIVASGTGGAVLRSAVVPPSLLTEARIGRSSSGVSPINGRVRRVLVGSGKLSDAQLLALCVVGAS